MSELRAALAVARKDFLWLLRYPLFLFAWIVLPLYQVLIPSFLFGATFLVDGKAVGLRASIGSDDLGAFLFLGSIIGGLIAQAFWGVAFGLRNEMDAGTLEAIWLTPTARETFVVGRMLSAFVVLLGSQALLLSIGSLFFGAHLTAALLSALPALALAAIALAGISLALAGLVLVVKEATFFLDTTNFLFAVASGTSFPITALPGVAQIASLLLPTTYAADLLRYHAMGARPLFDPVLSYAALAASAVLLIPLGRWAFTRADRHVRVRGTLGQH